MKKLLISVLLAILVHSISATGYFPCKLIMSDKSEKIGHALMPNMMDKKIRFKSENAEKIVFPSEEIKAIEFTEDDKTVRFERVLTYNYPNNKKVNKSDSWLEVINTGYVTLYYGFQQGRGSPETNLWYCLKKDETVAYFIYMDYSGGPVLTIGANRDFVKNASTYFSDYPELVRKLESKEYKSGDLPTVVDIYNQWKEN